MLHILGSQRRPAGKKEYPGVLKAPENLIALALSLALFVAAVYVFHISGAVGVVFPERDSLCKDCNVVLVTIDSLRWDHLGYMGYYRDTSPTLDRLASEGVIFSNAFAQSSFTPPSLGSILTSKYVSDHGLKTWGKLDDNQTTLPEILKENGYQTAAFTRVPKLEEQGLDQGIEYVKQGNYWRAEDMNRAVYKWLDKNRTGKFFLWVHYYDPHRRYEPLPPYDKMFNRAYDPRMDVQRQDKSFFQNLWKGAIVIDERQQWSLITQYDGEIAYTDSQLGALLDNLGGRGVLGNTIVVVSADHGETLNERPGNPRFMFVHDPMLYDQVTRVPLIMWGRSLPKGVRIESLVESIDIAPTILSILGISPDNASMKGWDLTRMFGQSVPEKKTVVYSECWGWEELKMVRSEDYKYIRDMRKKSEELYNLSSDRLEQVNIINITGNVPAEYRQKMQSFVDRYKHLPAKKTNMTKSMERRLRDLGYLS